VTETRWQARQRRHFDQRVGAYEKMYGDDTPFHRGVSRRLFTLASPKPDERVLDLGCGWGRTTLPLLAAGCRVTGLDISAATLAALAARVAAAGAGDRFTPVCLAAEEMAFERAFALVVGRGFLHHLERPPIVLRRVCRALAPGGRALFLDPNPLNPAWLPLHLLHPALSLGAERQLWRQTAGRVCRMLYEAGFERISAHYVGLVPPPLWRLGPAADRLENRLHRLPLLRSLALYKIVAAVAP